MPIQPGMKIGAYEVQELLGQGAMGTVYKAYHPDLARTAAVKVLHIIDPDADTSARFQREAQAIAAMSHPNILNVYDFGKIDGATYMIVAYMPGGSLADRAKAGENFTREEALDRLDEIAAALDYAHANGIVHRDVKPANVLIARNGSAVLADFGLAKLMQSVSVKTMSGVTTGTPAYMAPEQVTGSNVGPAADVYAFTTMAYEYLAGAIPFEGEGMMELLWAHVHREPPKASTRNPELSASVDAVLDRGLLKDPDARWQSCRELMAALRAALRGAPVEVKDAAPATILPMPAAPLAAIETTMVMAPSAPATATVLRSTRPRRGWVFAGAVLALLSVIAVGGAMLLKRPSPPPARAAVVTPSASPSPVPSPTPVQVPPRGALLQKAVLDGAHQDADINAASIRTPGATEIHYVPGALEFTVVRPTDRKNAAVVGLNQPGTPWIAELQIQGEPGSDAMLGLTFRVGRDNQYLLVINTAGQSMDVQSVESGAATPKNVVPTIAVAGLQNGTPFILAIVQDYPHLVIYVNRQSVAEFTDPHNDNAILNASAWGNSGTVRIQALAYYFLPR